jgi:hypothetical protein
MSIPCYSVIFEIFFECLGNLAALCSARFVSLKPFDHDLTAPLLRFATGFGSEKLVGLLQRLKHSALPWQTAKSSLAERELDTFSANLKFDKLRIFHRLS